MKHLGALGKYFWKYRVRLGAGILFVALSNYFNVLSPQLMRFIVNYVDQSLTLTGNNHLTETRGYDVLVKKMVEWVTGFSSIAKVVFIASIIILIMALLRGFFMFLMRQTIIVMSRHIEYDQKNEVYTQYQRLDSLFFKHHTTGDLMNRIAEDVSRVRIFTGPAIMYIVNLVTVIVLSVFFMVQSSLELTIYVLIPLPILAVIIYIVNSNIHKKSEKIQAALSDLTTNAQESYSGIRVIKSFVQENAMFRFFAINSEQYRKNAIALARVEAIYFPSIQLLIGISTLFTIMIGGLYYIQHEHNITLGTIVEFIVYVNMLTFPVSAIGLTASMVQRAAASQKRLNEFLDIVPEIKNETGATPVALDGTIAFNKVNFTYPDTGIRALQQFDLKIRKGEKIAITGKTGSGKTTVAQLLLRMYNADEGTIVMHERNIRDMDVFGLREQISYVPQDVFLFSDTVENNIRFGKPDATREEVIAAAEIAGVAREIDGFEKGYDTMIGERGVTLSGGQKQRISIARALIKESAVIIFDDSLSAVDAKTEKEIMGRLNAYLHEKTAIIITHRVFSLLSFDRIIVLDEGRIVEQGSHEALMKIPEGFYARLYQRQQMGLGTEDA
ncbi:ABC transporter ATP-binding protein [Niabella sp.]|uniref:ABC transporter ATP-binding protein n=1 Tax=Niabella sp. TaxID=1962976 RepID=UPI00262D0F94|nr:ABC transporter ATP-binding protein [Niabella sp.]